MMYTDIVMELQRIGKRVNQWMTQTVSVYRWDGVNSSFLASPSSTLPDIGGRSQSKVEVDAIGFTPQPESLLFLFYLISPFDGKPPHLVSILAFQLGLSFFCPKYFQAFYVYINMHQFKYIHIHIHIHINI